MHYIFITLTFQYKKNIQCFSLSLPGYIHKWVNHELFYVDPVTGVHTNRIESRFVCLEMLRFVCLEMLRRGKGWVKRMDVM